MVSSYTSKISKKTQKPFGIMMLEDLESSCELMLYERVLDSLNERSIKLEAGTEIILDVSVRRNEESESPRLVVEKVDLLDQAPEFYTEELYLHIYRKNLKPDTLKQLADICRKKVVPHGAKLILCLADPQETVFVESRIGEIHVDMELLSECEKLLGSRCYRIKSKEIVPVRRGWEKTAARQ
jgi:DNA polymerase-3 subunit alpha